jgi:hypothetical protein
MFGKLRRRSCLIGTTRWSIGQKRMARFTQRAGRSADSPFWPWSSRHGCSRSRDYAGTIHGLAWRCRAQGAADWNSRPPPSVVCGPSLPHAGAVSLGLPDAKEAAIGGPSGKRTTPPSLKRCLVALVWVRIAQSPGAYLSAWGSNGSIPIQKGRCLQRRRPF